MCNCNQKRANYAASNKESGNTESMVKVKLVRNEPIILTGIVSGRVYAFNNVDEINMVDRRDAMHMNEINCLQIL